MADIAPELAAAIKKTYDREKKKSKDVARALSDLQEGKADYVTAYRYANALSACLTVAFLDNISAEKLPNGKLYYNIAEKAVRPFLEGLEAEIAEYCVAVQNRLNEAAGLGIKSV